MSTNSARDSAWIWQNMISDIIQNAGYNVKMETIVNVADNVRNDIDIIASNDKEEKYFIETRYSVQKYVVDLSRYSNVILFLVNAAKANHAIPVFIISSIVGSNAKTEYEELYKGLIIVDLPNLLYSIKETQLSAEFISFLPFTVDDVIPQEGKLEMSFLMHYSTKAELIARLRRCPLGRDGAAQFEKVCTEILRNTFDRELTLWKEQYDSNNGLYRFDLLCRIKDDKPKPLWVMIQNFFHSKYIVFEYKNYAEPISQKEIYTTERYLYAKALRNVAIIIARKGYDEHAQWAAKGCLRENGKLILMLNEDELVNLFEKGQNDEEPSEFLWGKIDDMLGELEK